MKNLGILGGGQLAKLLALKASDLQIKAFVLSPKKTDPAAQVSRFWIQGDPHQAKDLQNFFSLVDIVTFESEFFSAVHIQNALQNLKGKKIHIAPSLKALSLIQNRWTQKKLLLKYQMNTADFVKVNFKNSDQKILLQLWDQLGPFVLKSQTGGYDGYGTFVIQKKPQIKNLKLPSQSFIAERFIPFKRELALLVGRNKKNQIVFFPLVESFQKDSRCLWIQGPAHHKKLNSLKKQIKKFLIGINYQGLMAFELFDTETDLLVNELAPRVHNTGHYSLSALSEDQFTAHLKAIFNFPLKNPRPLKEGFAMLNLLGEGSKNPCMNKSFGKGLPASLQNTIKQKIHLKTFFAIPLTKDIFLYWYGKTVSRKGRKMGHINAVGSSGKKALNTLLKIRKFFKV